MDGSHADFYIGLGKTAKWIGSVEGCGAPGDVTANWDLLNEAGAIDDYTETDFRDMVRHIITDARADNAGYRPEDGDEWPWRHLSSAETDYAYAYNNGCIHVFERGYMVAQHYPNGARRKSEFPERPWGSWPTPGGDT